MSTKTTTTTLIDPVTNVLDRLEGVKPRGEESWMALCPVHPDHHPSLSVTRGKDGRALLHCHAGCRTEDICAALGITPADLFASDSRTPSTANHQITRCRTVAKTDPPDLRFGELAAEYGAAANTILVERFAATIGVSALSLVRQGIGWAAEHRAWSFPLRNEQQLVTGIRLRSWQGHKWSVPGSRNGLFVPTNLAKSDPLLICEGPTDTAAALDLSFASVGRPSCNTGSKLLSKFVRGRDVVIIADNDPAGRQGAEHLADELILHCPSIRIVYPPEGIKDLRQWKAQGLTTAPLHEIIDHVERIKLVITHNVTKDAAPCCKISLT